MYCSVRVRVRVGVRVRVRVRVGVRVRVEGVSSRVYCSVRRGWLLLAGGTL